MDIQLYWKYLKYEIDAETWKSAKCYITADKAEERSEAQTGEDALDKNYCYRKIEQGIMQLQDIAHKFFLDFTRDTLPVEYVWKTVTNWNTLRKDDVVYIAVLDGSDKEEFTIKSVATDEDGITILTFTDDSTASSEDQICYIKEEVAQSESADNRLNNAVTYWNIRLRFGERQKVDVSLLANELHKYVALNVLQEWCKIANPTLTQEYMARQQAEELRIKNIIYRKEEPDLDEEDSNT